ncbi:hypothetical protein QCA50_003609 [Cerrena zonata]|uniref:Mnn4-regulates the mannosylphosphorylation n=1 Tax=Cerrena zonata TaxID=2478898 RepID=A0AAW0GKB4_9APHY
MIMNAFKTPLRVAPFLLRRPLSTSTKLSNPLLSSNITAAKALGSTHTHHGHLFIRGVASQVSGRPGSQSFEHAATNIKEELGNSSADLARTIAGGNVFQDSVSPTQQTFLGITNAVAHAVPTPYIIFGLAGALPYLGASGATIYLARQAGMAATGIVTNINPGVAITLLHQALDVQMTYGAVMLSFLGALHWGFEFAGFGGNKYYPRLLLGAAPVVWGWSTLAFSPMNALILQWAGFTGLWYADLKTTNAGWSPKWYSQYRFYLSVLVGTCIIGSLAATSYWGPVGGHGFLSHELEMVRADRREKSPSDHGVVAGDIEALPAGENADNYVIIRKKKHEDEGEGKNEEH